MNQYVERMVQRTPEGNAAHAAGCSLAVLMSGVGFFLLMRFVPFLVAGALSAFILLPLLSALAAIWVRALSRPKSEAEERRHEAHQTIVALHPVAARGKLHKRIDRAAGELLDECARHWFRIQTAFSGPFWEDRELSSYWRGIRDQSITAANSAMDDVIVMLRPELEPRNTMTTTQEIVGDILEAFTNVPADPSYKPLSATYYPAREIGHKLMLLADEVEETVQRAARDASFQEQYSSTSHLDQVLGELRAIKQAETELHQEIGGTGEG